MPRTIRFTISLSRYYLAELVGRKADTRQTDLHGQLDKGDKEDLRSPITEGGRWTQFVWAQVFDFYQ